MPCPFTLGPLTQRSFTPIIAQPRKYADHRTTTQNGIAQAMFKESSRTFEGRVRNRSRFGRRRSVPSTSLTATSLNNLTTLLVTQADLMAAMPLFEYIHATALDPEHPDTAAALCIHRGGTAAG